MTRMRGAAALHVLLMRVAFAQDAFEVYGWTADSVFTFAEMEAHHAEVEEVMESVQSAWNDRRRSWKTVRKPLLVVVLQAQKRLLWARDDVFARLVVMDAQSGGETDVEA